MTVRILYQGVSGAFSHKAAKKFGEEFFDSDWSACGVDTFPALFSELKSDSSAFAAVPLENSSIGPIYTVWELLLNSGCKIVCQAVVPVRLQLIGLPNARLEQLTEIRSHPAALAQCKRLFRAHPRIKAVEALDTAGSVREIVDRGDCSTGAIASAEALVVGSVIIKSDVHDFPDNNTRFALLSAGQVSCRQHVPDRRLIVVELTGVTAEAQAKDLAASPATTLVTVLQEPSLKISPRLAVEMLCTGDNVCLSDRGQDRGAYCRHL